MWRKNDCRNFGRGYEICTFAKRKRYSCGKVKVGETTAACDTFCGGMAVGLLEGKTLEQVCASGSVAETRACTGKGAQQSMPHGVMLHFVEYCLLACIWGEKNKLESV